MSIIITDECINCGACEAECPNHAIYTGGSNWTVAEGTNVSGSFKLRNRDEVDAYSEQSPLSMEYYFVVPDKCTECKGFHDEPQCAAVCPVDCCVTDPDNMEDESDLMNKQKQLHEA